MEKRNSASVQLVCAVFLIAIGAGILVAGFITAPRGEIHSSIQVIFGEILTFAAAVFGIDKSFGKGKSDLND